MLVGAMPDISYKSETTSVPENARLFVFCDGAYEITKPDHTMLDFDNEFVPYLASNGRSANIPQDLVNESASSMYDFDDPGKQRRSDLPGARRLARYLGRSRS